MSIDYSNHMDNPELVALCTNCVKRDCEGICDTYRARFRRIFAGSVQPEKSRLRTRNGEYGKLFEAFGERHTISDWARMKGLRYQVLYMRIHRQGMTMEQALTLRVKR